jgi:hypothetical protein
MRLITRLHFHQSFSYGLQIDEKRALSGGLQLLHLVLAEVEIGFVSTGEKPFACNRQRKRVVVCVRPPHALLTDRVQHSELNQFVGQEF